MIKKNVLRVIIDLEEKINGAPSHNEPLSCISNIMSYVWFSQSYLGLSFHISYSAYIKYS